VSAEDQPLDLQRDARAAAGCNRTYTPSRKAIETPV